MSATAPPAATAESAPPSERAASKYAFVTVGASASFKQLIEEVISDAVIAKLESHSFTHLIVQCGPDYEFFKNAVGIADAAGDAASPRGPSGEDGKGLIINGFAFKDDLYDDMELTTADESEEGVRVPGLIITHAGSGSILDALDLNANIVAVPNTSLMDNHQSEIAEEMEYQGFLVQGKIGSIADAIEKAAHHVNPCPWPPPAPPDSVWPGGLWQIIRSRMRPLPPDYVPVLQRPGAKPTDQLIAEFEAEWLAMKTELDEIVAKNVAKRDAELAAERDAPESSGWFGLGGLWRWLMG
ncbi:hypothetical protein GGR52DRAFT_558944 [Hypoxylon sp. FL1284]|nr:hypothetical protein GGR52DRAFT_558944 [Hypoxylon sp. FL1284]